MKINIIIIMLILSFTIVEGQDHSSCISNLQLQIEKIGEMDSLDQWYQKGSYTYLEHKVIATLPKSCQIDDTTKANLYHKVGINFHNEYGDVHTAKIYYEKALRIRENYFPSTHPLIIKGFNNLGSCFLDLSESGAGYYLDSAQLMLEQAMVLNKEREKPTSLLPITYFYLSQVFQIKGDIENTALYLQSAIELLEQDEEASFLLSFLKAQISFLYSNALKQPIKARVSSKEALAYYYLNPPLDSYDSLMMADWYFYLGTAQMFSNTYDSADFYFAKAFDLQLPYIQDAPARVAVVYNNAAINANLSADYHRSLQYLQQAIVLNQQAQSPADLADNYNNLGDAYYGLEKYDSAAYFYQQGIIHYIPNYAEPDPLSNPDMRQEVTFDVPLLLNTLAAKGKALLALYQQTQEHKHLQAAYETFITSDQMVEIVRQSYLTQGSKAALVKEAKPMYEQAIKTCDQLYELTQEARYLHSAFNFSEHSKAVILLDAVRVTRILKEDLPAQTSKQIQNAQAKRLYFETQLARDISTPGLRDSIMKYRKQQADYYSAFLTSSKNYHATQAIDQLNLKELVPSKEHALIEYFVGEENIYIFLLKSTQIHLYKSPKEADLNAWVSQLRNEIIQGVASRDVQISMHRLTEISHQLYQYLIAPLKSETLPHKLTIVRDDILELLPFELLIGEEIPMGTALEDIPYLFKSHIISYAFSANTKKIFEKNRVNPQKVALGLAPVDFANLSDFKLLTLPQTVKETQQIQEILNQGVEIYTGSQATSVRFLQQADEFAIIYIASHG
ncbi:MAG: CHAT domain-containing protein, partial [Bacteroidota bacterium]